MRGVEGTPAPPLREGGPVDVVMEGANSREDVEVLLECCVQQV